MKLSHKFFKSIQEFDDLNDIDSIKDLTDHYHKNNLIDLIVTVDHRTFIGFADASCAINTERENDSRIDSFDSVKGIDDIEFMKAVINKL